MHILDRGALFKSTAEQSFGACKLRGKGRAPKSTVPVDSISGCIVKSAATVAYVVAESYSGFAFGMRRAICTYIFCVQSARVAGFYYAKNKFSINPVGYVKGMSFKYEKV